jgi:hypothetical protein
MKLLPVRFSHLLSHSGVGAIVRAPGGLVVVRDIRQWTDRANQPAGAIIPYVERVRSVLDIEEDLREPPAAREARQGQVDGVCVPVTRFPFWARCPKCGKLHYRPWRAQQDDHPRCDCGAHVFLEQVAWVLVDPAGYLSDVPWPYLAHRKAATQEQRQCKTRDRLYLEEPEQGWHRSLRCAACGAKAEFDEREPMRFMGAMQPWLKEEAPADQAGATAQILTVNDVRVYSPEVDFVLVIPPESRLRQGTVVDNLYRNSGKRAEIDKASTLLERRSTLNRLAAEYRCQIADIEAALAEIERGYPLYGQCFTPDLLRESEYDAFLEPLSDQRDDEDFVTRDQSADWRALCRTLPSELCAGASPVRHLVQVNRLKGIRVFRGFRRMQGKNTVPADIDGTSDWLPAIPLYGEGIFLALEEGYLSCWEAHETVRQRVESLRRRFGQSGRGQPKSLTARFLLLHTLSHLLIRQLESEGGYPAAALAERLYCAKTPRTMAGILIYVAVPDIAGSLGGLAELAEPRRFLGILIRALEHARWCPLDPVCGEHEGQGPGLLNRAACHACALVPEPACEYGNTLLDRVFVKGDATSGFPSLFGAAT